MQYYGAGLIKLTGTKLSLHWHAHATSDLALQASRTERKDGVIDLNAFPDRSVSGAWAELTTVIPQNGSIPQRKTTKIHYHYDVTTNRQKTRRCKLYSILRKCDDKSLKSVNK